MKTCIMYNFKTCIMYFKTFIIKTVTTAPNATVSDFTAALHLLVQNQDGV